MNKKKYLLSIHLRGKIKTSLKLNKKKHECAFFLLRFNQSPRKRLKVTQGTTNTKKIGNPTKVIIIIIFIV